MIEEKVKLKRRGGGCFLNVKPKFSSCEESIFIVKQQNILQYSTKTGKLLKEYHGLESPVVGIDVAIINDSENLLALSEDGEFRAWKTATRFRTIRKNLSIDSKINTFHYLQSNGTEDLEGVITFVKSGRMCVSLLNIQKETFRNFKVKLADDKIFISASDKRFVAVADKRCVHFIKIDNEQKSTKDLITEKRFKDVYVTCLESHNQEEIVLAGDSEGKVILWQNIFGKNPIKSSYHWHTLPVNCVSFSPSGSYFYSGGNESVLVRWDWENSQDKKFLPRLPGNIKQVGVSAKNQFLGIFTSNNQIKIVDSNLNNVSSIQHFLVGDNYKSGIVLDPRTKALVMNGNIGELQFYQPKTDSLLYSIDIVSQNKRSNERNIEMTNVTVTKFAFNKNSIWFATVEQAQITDKMEMQSAESSLKFWTFDVSNQTYTLNTSIQTPHEGSINEIAFQYTEEDRCVTVGDDKVFKVWHLITVLNVNVETAVWTVMHIGKFCDMPCKGLSFHVDGSLMATGFGDTLTVWSTDSYQLKCQLNDQEKSDIEKVQFGTNNSSHLIVLVTNGRLTVWNILTLMRIWTVRLDVEFLFADKLSIFMGVITKQKELFIFSPNCSRPVYINKEILSSKQIVAAAFIPTDICLDTQFEWYKRVELFFIDSNKELFSIGAEAMQEYTAYPYVEDKPDEQTTSILNRVMKMDKVSNVSKAPVLQVVQKSQKDIMESLYTPAHLRPPPLLYLSAALKSLSLKKI